MITLIGSANLQCVLAVCLTHAPPRQGMIVSDRCVHLREPLTSKFNEGSGLGGRGAPAAEERNRAGKREGRARRGYGGQDNVRIVDTRILQGVSCRTKLLGLMHRPQPVHVCTHARISRNMLVHEQTNENRHVTMHSRALAVVVVHGNTRTRLYTQPHIA